MNDFVADCSCKKCGFKILIDLTCVKICPRCFSTEKNFPKDLFEPNNSRFIHTKEKSWDGTSESWMQAAADDDWERNKEYNLYREQGFGVKIK